MFSLKNPNTPKLSSDQDKMHPDDMRNLILFFVIAGVLYFAYDSFILKPQREAIQAHHVQSTKIASGEIPAPVPEKFIERPQALVANMSRVTIENPEVSGSINLQGARFDDLSLRAYYKELDKKENVSVLDPRGMKYFRTVEYGWVSHDKSVAVPDAKTQWSVRGNDKLTEGNPVTIFWNNNQGQIFEQTYSIDAHFMITVKQSVTNSAGQTIHLYPYGLIAQRGMPPKYQGTWVSYEGPVGYVGTELQQVGYSNLRKERKRALEANQGWTGVTDKYWLTTLMPQQGEKNHLHLQLLRQR
jgi:YidC/Oxa1 family membrane protein insertase